CRGARELPTDARLALDAGIDVGHDVFQVPSGGDGVLHRRMSTPPIWRGGEDGRVGLAYAVPVLPSLRRTRSSAYLMPLPLYGSGGRSERIFTAAAPMSSLSKERRVRPTVGMLSS